MEVDEVYDGGEEEGTEHRGRGAETKTLDDDADEEHKWQGDDEEQDDERGEDKKRKERKGKQAFHTKAGRIRIQVIADAKGVTLDKFINENVVERSNIWTDGHLGYKKSETLYPRRITVARTSDDPLPTLGRVTTNLKRWLMGTHKGAAQPQHLQAYLNECSAGQAGEGDADGAGAGGIAVGGLGRRVGPGPGAIRVRSTA